MMFVCLKQFKGKQEISRDLFTYRSEKWEEMQWSVD